MFLEPGRILNVDHVVLVTSETDDGGSARLVSGADIKLTAKELAKFVVWLESDAVEECLKFSEDSGD